MKKNRKHYLDKKETIISKQRVYEKVKKDKYVYNVFDYLGMSIGDGGFNDHAPIIGETKEAGGRRFIYQDYTLINDNTPWNKLFKWEQKEWLDMKYKKEYWNGREIYEGDKLRVLVDYHNIEKSKIERVDIVKFDGCFMIKHNYSLLPLFQFIRQHKLKVLWVRKPCIVWGSYSSLSLVLRNYKILNKIPRHKPW